MAQSPQAIAVQAQSRAGVSIRTLDDVDEQRVAIAVFDEVWPPDAGNTQVNPSLLRALHHSGAYVAAAFDQVTREPVGAALGFVARRLIDDAHPENAHSWTTYLHSDLVGVRAGYRDRSIGTAIKMHQRAWALDRGLDTIVWTFDPLVRRNARLNLHKLGVDVQGYETNFYGQMTDSVNAGDPSDRVFAWWDLTSPRALSAMGGPLPLLTPQENELIKTIATPEDIVALRASSPTEALQWRIRVRDQFRECFAAGFHVTGLDMNGSYVLERK